MNRQKRRIISILLAMMLCAPVFSACSDTTVQENPADAPNAEAQSAENPENAAAAEAEEEPDIYANLPAGDYGGGDFSMLQYEETSAATSTICVEELNGEAVNDAIFTRTQNVNERLNVNIVFTKTGLSDVNSIMSSSIVAGDDLHQVFWQHSTNTVTNFLTKGYLMQLDGIQGFDFENPWWNKNAMESLKLNEKTYMAFGDINYYLFDFQSIIICNMPMITDYNMQDPYTLVDEGTWTIDAFLGMVEGAAQDINGDGQLGTAEDVIGFTGFKTATELAFLHAADVSLFSRDADNKIVYDGVSEKYFEVLSRYSAIFGDKNYAEHNGDYLGRFRQGLTLFTGCSVGELSTMREVEFDYSVLPYPKYDEGQEGYISFITNQMQPMVIPITVQDTARAGVVLENLCGESHKVVRDKYFEVLLESKYVRDQKAIDTLHMLYGSDGRFEIAHVYGWNQLENDVTAALTGAADTFISSMEKKEKALVKVMDRTMQALAE
ncbi:MAG: hypothetical protein J6D10_09830 [Clostridia bacterium]|nr:hypothetical protein [Clostridia bacterium]